MTFESPADYSYGLCTMCNVYVYQQKRWVYSVAPHIISTLHKVAVNLL